MEKRKFEILNSFNKITEEKTSIENYLSNIAKQVENCTEILNTGSNEDLKKSKYILKAQIYAFQLLEKLSEISYELEIFCEDNKPPECLAISSISRCSSVCEELSAPSTMDITKLKEQVQKIEKLNHTTHEVIEYVAKFYNNSNSCNGYNLQEKSCKMENVINIPVNIPTKSTEPKQENETKSDFKINNNINHIKIKQDCCNDLTEPNYSEHVVDSDSDLDIIEVKELQMYSEGTSTIESTSSSSSTNFGTSSSSDHYTAIKKLKEANLYDRKQEASKQITPGYIPDIALKPLLNENGDVPSNKSKYLTLSTKIKKKKNRKKDKNDIADYLGDIKDFEIPSENDECLFSHIESPSEFYIHVSNENSAMIDIIGQQIYQYCHNTSCPFLTKIEAKAKLGRFCLAYSVKYECWYRVEILDWFLSNLEQKQEDVLVQFVDYGDKARISFTNLRPLNKDLCHIPKLAVRCHFPLLYPPESTIDNLLTEWPQDTVDALYNVSGLHENKNIIFRIEYCEKIDNSVSLDICNTNNGDKITVGQLLIDLQLAVQIINDLPDIEEDEGLHYFLQDADEFGQAESLVAAVQGYDAKDELRTCKFTMRGEDCFKGDRCPFSHTPLREGGFTSDKVLISTQAINSIHIPEIGSRISILITGSINICHFYVHVIRTPASMTSYDIDQQLCNLIELMNNIDVMKTYAPFKIWPAVGEIVVVKHYATKKWLRGKVRHITYNENGEPKVIQVFLVDFGETVEVFPDKIKQINEDFLHLPFQAIECYLSDVKVNPDVNILEASKFFQENCCFRNFIAIVLSRREPLQLSIFTNKGVEMSKILMQYGMAVKRTEDCCPADTCTFSLQ